MTLPSDQTRHQRASIAFCLCILLCFKVALVLAAGPMALELDALEYWKLSSQVLAGDFWLLDRPIAYRTPIYPWFLAAIRLMTGSSGLLSVVIVQGGLLVATSWLASSLAVLFTQKESARIWTLLASLVAISAVPFGRAILSEVVFAFCLTLHLYLQALYFQERTMMRAIGASLSLAVCILTRPIAMLLWVVHMIWLLLPGYRHGRHWVLMMAVFVLALAPWAYRNAVLFGKPSLTEFMGRNLWIVTFQEQAGAGMSLPSNSAFQEFNERIADLQPNEEWRNTWSVSNALVASGLNDAETDRAMLRACVSVIAERPALFAERTIRRIVNFWRCVSTHIPYPTTDPELLDGQMGWSYPNRLMELAIENRWSLSVVVNTVFSSVTGLAVVFLVINGPSRWWGLWAGLVLVYFSLVTGCFEIPAYRYRMVVEPLMWAVLGAGLSTFFPCFRKVSH